MAMVFVASGVEVQVFLLLVLFLLLLKVFQLVSFSLPLLLSHSDVLTCASTLQQKMITIRCKVKVQMRNVLALTLPFFPLSQ